MYLTRCSTLRLSTRHFVMFFLLDANNILLPIVSNNYNGLPFCSHSIDNTFSLRVATKCVAKFI
jgi:hypothetical protein